MVTASVKPELRMTTTVRVRGYEHQETNAMFPKIKVNAYAPTAKPLRANRRAKLGSKSRGTAVELFPLKVAMLLGYVRYPCEP